MASQSLRPPATFHSVSGTIPRLRTSISPCPTRPTLQNSTCPRWPRFREPVPIRTSRSRPPAEPRWPSSTRRRDSTNTGRPATRPGWTTWGPSSGNSTSTSGGAAVTWAYSIVTASNTVAGGTNNHIFRIVARDNDGSLNYSNPYSTMTFVIDYQAPMSTATSPAWAIPGWGVYPPSAG